MTCPSLERIAAWFLAATDDEESGRTEEHVFSCDRCAGRAERMEALVEHLRASFPPVLTPGRRKQFEERMPEVPTSVVSPGASAILQFREGTDIGLWVMRHDLSGAERVDCLLMAEDGSEQFSLPDVPFDAERQEVVLVCHNHFRNLGPSDVVARLTSTDGDGQSRTAEYKLIHRFFDPTV